MPRRRAYYVDDTMGRPGGYSPVIAEENTAGYFPTDYVYGPTIKDAKRQVAEVNTELGLTADDVLDIVASSMAAQFNNSFEGRSQDRINLDLFLREVRRLVPKAKAVDLSTSDQDHYGFNLDAVVLEDGTITQDVEAWDTLTGLAWDHLCNISWNGVVGESKHGDATVEIPD